MSALPPVINLRDVTLVIATDDDVLIVDDQGATEIVPAPTATLYVDADTQVLAIEDESILVLSFGEQGPPGGDGLGSVGPTALLTGMAGVTLQGHVIVRLDATGRYVPADANNPMDGVLAIGMTTGVAVEASEVIVITNGPFVEPSWGWVPNKPVYLGADGALTQSPLPGAAFIKQVGLALTPQLVSIDFREPIYF